MYSRSKQFFWFFVPNNNNLIEVVRFNEHFNTHFVMYNNEDSDIIYIQPRLIFSELSEEDVIVLIKPNGFIKTNKIKEQAILHVKHMLRVLICLLVENVVVIEHEY